MVKDFKKKFRMFALANGFDVPKFMEEDPDEMDDDVRHLMKQNKIASKHNKEQIQRIYVRLICVSFCEGTISAPTANIKTKAVETCPWVGGQDLEWKGGWQKTDIWSKTPIFKWF